SFEVNKVVLPAGTYTVESSVANGLLINGRRTGALVLATPMSSPDLSPRLVFHRYGDAYILREVWMGGGNGKGLPETRRERELAASAGGANTASFQRVEVPLL